MDARGAGVDHVGFDEAFASNDRSKFAKHFDWYSAWAGFGNQLIDAAHGFFFPVTFFCTAFTVAR